MPGGDRAKLAVRWLSPDDPDDEPASWSCFSGFPGIHFHDILGRWLGFIGCWVGAKELKKIGKWTGRSIHLHLWH